jgi:hypothetical protein
MEADTKTDLLDRLHVAMRELGTPERGLREKIALFALGAGHTLILKNGSVRWHFEATIAALRAELEMFTAHSILNSTTKLVDSVRGVLRGG